MTNGDTLTAADAKVIEMHLAGSTGAEIARQLGVSRQAVHKHLHKHSEDVAAKKQALVDAVVDNWITDKVERINRLTGLYEGMATIVEERGLLAIEPRVLGNGENAERIDLVKFDAALVQQMRGVLSDVSDELGQKPRPNVNINTGIQLLIRDYGGLLNE